MIEAIEKKNNFGFTLIEVLIALLIIAIALAAVIKATNDSVHATIHVRNTMSAHWVAMNLISEMQTGQLKPPGSLSAISGKSVMLNQTFSWTATQDTRFKLIGSRRVDVRVYLNNKLINTVSGFIR